jgi:tetratricopeptide (TPR) repeat protein
LNLREPLARERPDDPEVQAALGQTLNNFGFVLDRQGRKTEARDLYIRAAKYQRIAFENAPWTVRYGRNLAISTNNVARMQRHLGQNDDALRWYERAVGTRKKLAEENPAVPDLWESLFATYQDIAGLQRDLNHPTEAARWPRQARDVIERIPRENAGNLYLLARARARCAESRGWGTNELTSGEKAEQQHDADLAIDALHKAVAAGLKDVAELNNNQDFAVLRGRAEFKALLVKLEAGAGQTGTVLNASEMAALVAAQKKQVAADPDNRQLQADLAASQHALGMIHFGPGKMDEAQNHIDQAVTLREALVNDEPENARYQADLAASRAYRHLVGARRLVEQNRNKEAEADFRKAVEVLDDRALEALALPSGRFASEADQLFARLVDDALLTKLSAEIGRNPGDMARRWSRGEWYARRARWKEAAADLTTALDARMALSSDSAGKVEQWMYVATVLAMGDREGYRRLCREMLNRFGETQDPDTAARIAKIHLLLPEFVPEMEKACRLADRAVSLQKNHPNMVWFLHGKGLADYRRGNFRAAIEGLEPMVPADGVGWPSLTTVIHLGLAMARYQQGEEKAAREHLARAVKLLNDYLIDPARSPLQKDSRYDRPNWAIAWLLYREARALAEKAFMKDVAVREKLVTDFPREDRHIWDLAACYIDAGHFLQDDKRYDEAAKIYDRACKFLEAGQAQFPEQTEYRAELGRIHNHIGWLLGSSGRLSEQEKSHRQALDIYKKLVGVKSKPELNRRHRQELMWTYENLGHALTSSNRLQEAEKAFRQAIAPGEQLNTEFPNQGYLGWVVKEYHNLVTLHIRQGQWDKAAAECTKIDLLTQPPGEDAYAYACLLLIRGDSEGYNRFCQGMIRRAALPADYNEAFFLARSCAMARKSPVDPAQAVQWATKAVTGAQIGQYFHVLGLAQYRAGQLEQALQNFAKGNVEYWPARDLNWFGLALVHHRLGHAAEARQCLDSGIQWMERCRSAGPAGLANIDPSDWVEAQVLRREAEEALKTK